jgi:hypothetical protein
MTIQWAAVAGSTIAGYHFYWNRSSGDSSKDSGTCNFCGIRGHSRKRKSEQRSIRKEEEPDRNKARSVDDLLEQLTNRKFVTRHVPGKGNTTSLLTLDSGATTHMVPKSIADVVEDVDIEESEQAVETAKPGVHFQAIAKGRLGSLRNTLITNDGVLARRELHRFRNSTKTGILHFVEMV